MLVITMNQLQAGPKYKQQAIVCHGFTHQATQRYSMAFYPGRAAYSIEPETGL